MIEQNCTTLSQLFQQVRAQEVSIETINIHAYIVAEKKYRLFPIELGAETLYYAASLIYIKSMKLLPRPPKEVDSEEAVIDTAQLAQYIAEYQIVKQAAYKLRALGEKQRAFFTRPVLETNNEPIKRFGIEHLTLEELGNLFQNALKRVEESKELASTFIQVEGESVSDRLDLLKKRVAVHGKLLWDEVFVLNTSKQDLILWFLALLEWLKEGCGAVFLENQEYIIKKHG